MSTKTDKRQIYDGPEVPGFSASQNLSTAEEASYSCCVLNLQSHCYLSCSIILISHFIYIKSNLFSLFSCRTL